MIGPVEVVDDEHQRSARREVGQRVIDGVEEAMARAGVVAVARLERFGYARSRERFGERLERRERLLRATSLEHGSAGREGGGGEMVGEACLADSGLARDEHDSPVVMHLHATPRRT